MDNHLNWINFQILVIQNECLIYMGQTSPGKYNICPVLFRLKE